MAVFISYSHADADIVHKIAVHLVKENVHVWVDKWELNYGDSLLQKIQDAISDSSVLLVMLSKSSVSSEWCKRELTAGLVRELEERHVVVVPVLLEDCAIPLFLRDKYYADFREEFDEAFPKLHASLQRMVDINMNRVATDEYLVDWAVDQGEKDDRWWFNIDSVSFEKKDREYSVLCTLTVTGNETVTRMVRSAPDRRGHQIFVDEMIKSLVAMDLQQDFRILLDNNEAKRISFGIRDSDRDLQFNIDIYCRRMGINNGFDVLFDYGSIIRLIGEKRSEIVGYPAP